MLHPLAWKYDPIPTSLLEPVSMCIVEGAASYEPAYEERDIEIATHTSQAFLDQHTRDISPIQRLSFTIMNKSIVIPPPLRYCSDSVIVQDQVKSQATLCSANRGYAFTGWLTGICRPVEISNVIETVQKQENIDTFVDDPEDLYLGLWLELCTSPPIDGPLAPFYTMVYAQVPGVQLFKFPVKGSSNS